MWKFIAACFLFAFMSFEAFAQLPTRHQLRLENRRVELVNGKKCMLVDVFYRTSPNSSIHLMDFSIYVRYNRNALSTQAFHATKINQWKTNNLHSNLSNHGQEAWFYDVLALPGFDDFSIDYIANSQIPPKLPAPFVQNADASNVWRLGTFIFEVLDETAEHNLQLNATLTTIFYYDVNSQRVRQIPKTDIKFLQTPEGAVDIYSLPCLDTYFQPSNCALYKEVERQAPLTTPQMAHWDGTSTGGPTKIKYIADFFNTAQQPKVADRYNFNTSHLQSLLDKAICEWETVLDNKIVFETTSHGGRIYWATSKDQMINASGADAETYFVFDGPDNAYIVDTLPSCNSTVKSTRIVLNNTPDFYLSQNTPYWTTAYQPWMDGFDASVYSNFYRVIIHELGHFIGLPHNNKGLNVMNTGLYRSINSLKPTLCDTDAARRLYHTTAYNSPVPTTVNCSWPTNIDEFKPYVTDDCFLVTSVLGVPAISQVDPRSEIRAVDLQGREVATTTADGAGEGLLNRLPKGFLIVTAFVSGELCSVKLFNQ